MSARFPSHPLASFTSVLAGVSLVLSLGCANLDAPPSQIPTDVASVDVASSGDAANPGDSLVDAAADSDASTVATSDGDAATSRPFDAAQADVSADSKGAADGDNANDSATSVASDAEATLDVLMEDAGSNGVDAGSSSDGVVLDSAVLDSAVLDSAVLDSAVLDSAVLDSAEVDNGAPDAAVSDSAAGECAADVADCPDAATPTLYTNAVHPTKLPLSKFTDVTEEYGINPLFVYEICVAVADFDNNGRDDFVTLRRKGQQNIISAVLLSDAKPKHVHTDFDNTTAAPTFSCSAFDINGDNKVDLLFGGFSGMALYLGDGKGGFKDASSTYLPYVMDFHAFTVVPADLDNDGDLDLFVGAGQFFPSCNALDCKFTPSDLICWVDPPIPQVAQLEDRVLIQGAKWPLTDQSKKWNVPKSGTQTVAMAMDVDGDGKLDILAGDDFGSSRLLHNVGGKFTSFSTEIGLHVYSGSMGWTAGDFNNDGKPDLVLAESGPAPVYVQKAPKKGHPIGLVDMGGVYGTWPSTWGASAWAPLVADFDHNGEDDLVLPVAVHIPVEKAADPKALCAQSQQGFGTLFAGAPSVDLLYLGMPGTQKRVAQRLPTGKHSHIIYIEQKTIDLDGDGDLDLVQTRPGGTENPTSQMRILRNDLIKVGGSFTVRLTGKGKNMDALGATVTANVGGVVRTRWLNGSGGMGGTPNRLAHFGLGKAGLATDIKVRWPDGKITKLGSAKPGAKLLSTWP